MNLSIQDTASQHLSEEAIDGFLIGGASAADQHHLAACEICTKRLAMFRKSLATFNQASAAWSDARCNTISRELTPRTSSHSATAAWSLACMTVLAVVVSLTSHLHRSPDLAAFGASEQPVIQPPASEQQEIANDNAILAAIDSKLSEPVHSPVVAYGEESITPGTRKASGSSEVRD